MKKLFCVLAATVFLFGVAGMLASASGAPRETYASGDAIPVFVYCESVKHVEELIDRYATGTPRESHTLEARKELMKYCTVHKTSVRIAYLKSFVKLYDGWNIWSVSKTPLGETIGFTGIEITNSI